MSLGPTISPIIRPNISPVLGDLNTSASRILVSPSLGLSPSLTFSRASSAAFIRSTDGVLAEVGDNVPRFDPDFGLLITSQRTNLARNPRWEGAIAGTPGTLPSTTGLFISPSGITREVVGVVTTNGVAEYRIRFFGTPSTSGEITVYPLPAVVAATPATLVVNAVRARLAAGSLSNVSSVALRVLEYLGGAYVREGGTAIALTSTAQPFSRVHTVGAGVDNVVPAYSVSGTAGQPMDITLGFSLPEVALAPFAQPYSPILPPAGAPGVTTRFTDILSSPLPSLGIGSNGACTIVGTFAIPQTGNFPNLMEINAGSIQNRAWVYWFNNDVGLFRLTSNVSQQIQIASGIAPGTAFTVAMSHDGTGRVVATVNGGSIQAVTGAPTAYANLRVGSGFAGDQPLNGYVQRASMLPYPVSDATLQQFSA